MGLWPAHEADGAHDRGHAKPGVETQCRRPPRAHRPGGAIAVDARTRRVFVLNQGAMIPQSLAPNGHGSVSVLDADTGRLIRTIALGRDLFLGLPPGGSMIVAERTGRVFVSTCGVASGGLSRAPEPLLILDARSGQVVRRLTEGPDVCVLAVDERLGRVYLSTRQVLDARTDVDVGRTVPATAMAVDAALGRLFAVDGSHMRMIDARTDKILVTRAVPGARVALVDERRNRVVVGIVPDSYYYDENAEIFDARTVRVITDAVDGGGDAWGIDRAAGRVISIGTRTSNASPSIIDADIFDTTDGRHNRFFEVGDVIHPAATIGVDERRGYAFVVTADAQTGGSPYPNVISIIDTIHRRLVRQIGLGLGPPSIAVDEARGRVYVTNLQDNTVSVLDDTRL